MSDERLTLAKKLAAYEPLQDEDLMEIEALGFRAQQAKCQEVVEAVATVICALQGNYGRTLDEIKGDDA